MKRILMFAVVALVLPLGTTAHSEPETPNPPPVGSPLPETAAPQAGAVPAVPDAQSESNPPHAPAAAAKDEADQGPPGMMGNPWPKTPEEADKTLHKLFGHLSTTGDALQAGQIALSIEKLWRLPGGDTVNLLIDRAAQFAAKNEQDKALKLLNAAVDLAPDYPEAWNRRAYVYYRMDNTAAALGDLRRALALEPNHFRALDGMAKMLEGIGEKKNALRAYDQLLKIYPEIEGAKERAEELRKEVDGQGI